MDGVHDLGGREGFGPIVGKADDKVIHADWEIRDFAMKQSSAAGQELDDRLVPPLPRAHRSDRLSDAALLRSMADDARRAADRRRLSRRSTRSRRAPRPSRRNPAFRRRARRPRAAYVKMAEEFRRQRQHAAALRAWREGAMPARRRLGPYAPAQICAGQGRGDPQPSRRPCFRRRGGARRASRRASLYRELRFCRTFGRRRKGAPTASLSISGRAILSPPEPAQAFSRPRTASRCLASRGTRRRWRSPTSL